MGTWVKCLICEKELPRKYKTRKERKEIFEATCNNCPKKQARKKYEEGIKRGIWLKKWKKATNSFKKASELYSTFNEESTVLTIELMYIMSSLELNPSPEATLQVITQLLSGRYDKFLGKKFQIPEFYDFDTVYNEAAGWVNFFEATKIESILQKAAEMKKAAHYFFNMEYGQLIFSKFFLKKKITNVVQALQIEALTEKELGMYYTDVDDIENASIHLNFAAISFTNLEDFETAKELKMFRKALRMERTCWICGTRSRGYVRRFKYRFTRSLEIDYDRVSELINQRQEQNPLMSKDTLYTTSDPQILVENFDRKDNGLYLSICNVCGGTLEQISQEIVDTALIPVWQEIKRLSDEIIIIDTNLNNLSATVNSIIANMSDLANAINDLNRNSHTHG